MIVNKLWAEKCLRVMHSIPNRVPSSLVRPIGLIAREKYFGLPGVIHFKAKTRSIVPISGFGVAVYGFLLEHESSQGARSIFLTQRDLNGFGSY